jgi:hypothetical protein
MRPANGVLDQLIDALSLPGGSRVDRLLCPADIAAVQCVCVPVCCGSLRGAGVTPDGAG